MKKNFTLIELLVVVAILSLLMSILLPSLAKGREIAKTAVCLSQLKQTATAYMMYTGENNGRTIPRFPTYPRKTVNWIGSIYTYHNDPNLLKCPSATHLSTDESVENYWGSAKTGWAGDSGYWTMGEHKGRGSYGLNAWTWSFDIDGEKTTDSYFRSFAEFNSPYNSPLFFDSNWINAQPNRNQNPTSSSGSETNSIGRIYLDRHYQKKVNHVMADSSAKTIKIDNLYKLDWNQTFLQRDLPLL